MARSARQSKILEIISGNEIGAQEELVASLKAAGYDVTQATISRDIKELGLIKTTTESGKYKYAYVDSGEQFSAQNKVAGIFKEAVISIKPALNLVIVKTLRGTASAVSSFIDRLAIENVLGCVNGDDTVMVILPDAGAAPSISARLNEILIQG
ncbi:MAG: arginine repressor [Firmicutes bacterium]|nr:arginine repressor [Bacillota bacterium]